MTDPLSQFQSSAQDAFTNAPGASSEQVQSQLHPDVQNLSSARPYADLKYLFGVQDPTMLPTKSGRNRRKSAPGLENVKHRRTRSGCFTCRARRVKCDEKHPICERCKKGNRECKYPDQANSAKTTSGSARSGLGSTHQSPGSSSEEYEDDEEDAGQLESIIDDEGMLEDLKRPQNFMSPGLRRQNTDQSLRHQKSSTRHSSETPSLDKGPSPSPSSPSTEESYPGSSRPSGGADLRTNSLSFEARRKNWAHLPRDLQYFLAWFYENITCQHYSLKHDSTNFLKTIFLDQVLNNEALLNAVIGFTSFQHTLQTPSAHMEFLQYYNKAVSLLLRSLKQGDHRHSIGTLLTILQLATIEEYLGDWINLLGHQKAAYEIMNYLFTPETVMHTEIGRMVLKWYSRFDVFGSLLGGFETVLSREWFSSNQHYLHTKAQEHPEDLDWKIDAANSTLKLIAVDMTILFTMVGKGAISREEFMAKNEGLARAIADWKENLDPALQNPRYVVTDFSNARPLDSRDIVNPYRPGILYEGPLWPINVSIVDWYALGLMHQYQTSLILGSSVPNDTLASRAFCTCEMFEAIEFWPGSPKGSVLGCQASLGIASLFLPRDTKHSMWVRRKLATIESNGYIYPLTFRKKMSALFQDSTCMHWWLPNEENFTPIVRAIRSFVESRTTLPVDVPQTTEDLSNMKAIFSSLNLGHGGETSLPSPPTSSREGDQGGKAKERAGSGGADVGNWGEGVDFNLMGDMAGMMGPRLGEMSWGGTPGGDCDSAHGYWIQEQQESQHPQYDDYS